jgi:hypothetical protein
MRLKYGIVALALAVVGLAALAPVGAQEQGKAPPKREEKEAGPPQDYREYFTKPTNAAEYWSAIQFEIEVGRYDLAAGLLHDLLAYRPSDAEWVRLADQVGMAAFLRLRNVAKWSDNAGVNKRVRDDVEELIKRVTAAVKKVRGDPRRIRMFIANLLESPEEHDYALKELYKAGAVAVPYLIDAIRKAPLADRVTLVDALRRMGPDTLAPIRAALDSNDANLVADLIDIIRKRAALEAVPDLWYLSASPREPDVVRQKATATLAAFLELPPAKLPPAPAELTAEAERYYRHEVRFADPAAVPVWRWDRDRLVEGWPGAPTVPASRAEEYYGLKYAGQALALDPTYAPAQVVWLSLALDKAQEAAGLARPLGLAAPDAQAMLSSVNVELVNAVLERALRERRLPVILAAVRELGARDAVQAIRPASGIVPPLVRALYYPDRRVQLAAAEAIVRIPGSASAHATTRLVEVLRRALAADPGPPTPAIRPKVIVGYFDPDQRTRVAHAVVAAGFEPVQVPTARVLLQRLAEAGDIELALIDQDLPDPELVHLLAQLRSDVNVGLMPVVITAPARCVEGLARHVARQGNVTVVPEAILADAVGLKQLLVSLVGDPAGPALAPAERKELAERAVVLLARLAWGEPPGYDVRPAAATIVDALRQPPRLRPEGQIAAAAAAARLPGGEPQQALADVALDAKRPLAVRVAAAADLVRHIQAYGRLLSRAQAQALAALNADAATPPQLREQLALVLGSLQPDARASGERLLRYQPPPPAAPPRGKD